MSSKTLILAILCVVSYLSACQYLGNNTQKDKGEVVAQVYNRYLYESDVKTLNLSELSHDDSLAMVRQYVDNWLRENAVLFQAQDQLSNEKINEIEKQIDDYKNSLVLYLYENELVNQKLDTTVTAAESQKFYTENPQNFVLKSDIVKARYFICPLPNPEIEVIEEWFEKLDEDNNLDNLNEAGFKYNAKFNLEGQWFTFDDFIEKFPINTSKKPQKFLEDNTKFNISDSLQTYLIKIDDYTLIGQTAPYEYCYNDLKTIVLNKRQRDFLKSTKKKIYDEAVSQNKVQIYTDIN